MGSGSITGLYAGLAGLLFLALCWRVTRYRRQFQVGIGDGGQPQLARAIRVQVNFTEYVPVILLLLLVLEVSGFSPTKIHALGIAIFAARVLHAWGLSQSSGRSFGRFWGTFLTWLTLASAALLAIAGFFGFRI